MTMTPKIGAVIVLILLAVICPQCSVCAGENDGSLQEDENRYDFIVVGAGTSGCVVASRLSEKFKVLLIGDGGDPPGKVLDVPATVLGLIGDSEYTKLYPSVMQNNVGLGNNGIFYTMIGTVHGGGSSVNGMIWNRGSPFDYDSWANITNDPSWSYDNLLKYFKRVEDQGNGGRIPISKKKYAPGLEEWLEAGRFLGYPVGDLNEPQKVWCYGHTCHFNEIMRSGIGPEEFLRQAKITPRKILPVGNNLQNHFLVKMNFIVARNQSQVFIPEQDLTPENWKLFEESGEGPYSSLNGIHGQAFLTSAKRVATGQPEWADLQINLVQSNAMINVIPEEANKSEDDSDIGISALVILVRPQSSGKMSLNPEEINEPPLIDFKYLSHPDDIEVLMEGIKFVLKIIEETPSYQRQGARYSDMPYGPCAEFSFRSDNYWRCFIRHQGGNAMHAGGTCRMGKGKKDPGAVVDSKLKVIGIQGLRVVDLSVMPNVTNANTQAAAYVIGEKASEEILEELKGGNARQEL